MAWWAVPGVSTSEIYFESRSHHWLSTSTSLSVGTRTLFNPNTFLFFRDLGVTARTRKSSSLYITISEIVAIPVFRFWSRNKFCHASCLWPVKSETRAVLGDFPMENDYSPKILIEPSFRLYCTFVLYHFSAASLFASLLAYKYPRDDISYVTYRRGDSCRNSSALNFNARFFLYPHWISLAKRS